MRDVGILLFAALLFGRAAAGAEAVPDESSAKPEAEPAAAPQSSPSASTGASEPGPYTEISNSVANYEQDLERIEAEGGAFDGRLGETLTSLGLLRMAVGDHAGAEKALDRALFITRINQGLYSLAQVPLIELEIRNNNAWDRPAALDKNLQHLYWLYRRNFGSDETRMLPLIDQIGRERLDAFYSTPTTLSIGHAVQADRLYDSAIDILEKHPEERAGLIAALYHRALANWDIALIATDTWQSMPQIRKALLESGRGGLDVDETKARDDLFTATYYKGMVSVERVVKLTAEDTGADYIAYAQALLFAGDYNYSFGRNWDAMDYYKDAWKALVQHNAPPAEFERLFGTAVCVEPVQIPGEAEPEPNAFRHWVEAEADITDRGWPENVHIIATHPANDEELARRGIRAVEGVRHRPRFENGEPVASHGVKVRYIFRQY